MSSDSLAESTSPALSEAKVARAKRIVNEFSGTSTAQRAVKNLASGVIEGLQESDEVLADEAPVVTDFPSDDPSGVSQTRYRNSRAGRCRQKRIHLGGNHV
jgi:hypothetical protein